MFKKSSYVFLIPGKHFLNTFFFFLGSDGQREQGIIGCSRYSRLSDVFLSDVLLDVLVRRFCRVFQVAWFAK